MSKPDPSLTVHASDERARKAAVHLLRGKNALTKADIQFLNELDALTDEAEKERLKKLMTDHAVQRAQAVKSLSLLRILLLYLVLPTVVFGAFANFLSAALKNTLTPGTWVGFGIGAAVLVAYLVWLIATRRKPTVFSCLWAGFWLMALFSLTASELPPEHPLVIVYTVILLAYLAAVLVFLILWILKKPRSFLRVLLFVLPFVPILLYSSAVNDIKTHQTDIYTWIKFGVLGASLLAIVISGIVNAVSERRRKKHMTERAQGTVAEVIEIVGKNRDGQRTRSYKLKVRYFAGGEAREFTTDADFEYVRKNGFEEMKGQPIPVLYDPEKPENARLNLEEGK